MVELTTTSFSETVTGGEVSEEGPEATSTHFFTPQNPSYAGDSKDSHLTGQVKYASSKLTFAWSVKLHTNHSAAATGPMNEVATATRNGKSIGYKDSHPGVPANYTVHSSFRVDTSHYVLSVDETFPIAGGVRKVHTSFDFTVTLV
ncbi:hypothetical protein ACFCV8_23065 [Streptomyces sp. NPDC056347]|uniref:hypothetical protein n=1 Tax=Streptomyces sp. NPDC056347 TaxID=3345790 RepID=UPI0035E0DEF9